MHASKQTRAKQEKVTRTESTEQVVPESVLPESDWSSEPVREVKMATPDDRGDGMRVEQDGKPGTAATLEAQIRDIAERHGTPKKIPMAKFVAQRSQIYALFGATKQEQKTAVDNTLTYLAIVHGCGPNVDWAKVEASPPGCKTLTMEKVVDGVITRLYHRRFMAHYSARAVQMYEASPQLQSSLVERAVRNGLPLTDSVSVIDFLDSSSGLSNGALAQRIKAKSSAVSRANRQGLTSTERVASATAEDMHRYHDADADSLAG